VAKTVRKKGTSAKRGKASAKGAAKAKAADQKPTETQASPVGRRPKSPLSKAELREFRNILLQKRRDLIGDMSGIESEALRSRHQTGSGDGSNHPADLGTDNFEQEFTLGLLESERVMLKEINEALGRIDERTYGVCLGTGAAISKSRLRARPWAKYCIEYARQLEKGLVRPGEETQRQEEGATEE